MMLSLIIPVYNVEKYINKCILSCLNQEGVDLGHDYEIIIINDGSPDKSIEIARELTNTYNGVTIIDQNNQGLSIARNNGLSIAKGEYVWFIDSDDWIEDDAVITITSRIKAGCQDVIKIRAFNAYPDGDVSERQPKYDDELNTFGRVEGPKSFCETPAQFNILKREWLLCNKLQFMPGVYHEDNEFIPRMYWFAKSVGFINKPLYYYRQTPNSITNSLNPKKSYDLIKVCNSLSKFIEANSIEKDKKFYKAISAFISITLNSAFFNIVMQSKNEQIKFDKAFSENMHLIKFLFLSKKAKFILEGIMWKTNRHYTSIYKYLKKFS